MQSVSALQLVFIIIAVLAIIGVVVTFLRSRMTFSGYEDYVADIHRLGLLLQGETFRDGPDVVVSGVWDKRPTVVRFSNQENTPGLNIRMAAPAFFQISVVPASVAVTEGPRTPIKTTDDQFDSRFTTRTDQPTHARLLITRQFTALLQKLACSKNTFLAIGSGTIELSELVVPYGPAQHISEHLKSMSAVATSLRTMPGSETVKVITFERERHTATHVAMAVGVLVALLSIVGAMQVRPRPVSGVNDSFNNGILPIDATLIRDAPQWHAATATDFDAMGADMLRSDGVEPRGRIEGDFIGNGSHDDAYLLVDAGNRRRVVILAGHQMRYDSQMPALGMIARVPHDSVASIRWKNDKGPAGVAGDGVLIVVRPEDPASGVVLFVTPSGITSAAPLNWRDVPVG
jgi:hypothetical protein